MAEHVTTAQAYFKATSERDERPHSVAEARPLMSSIEWRRWYDWPAYHRPSTYHRRAAGPEICWHCGRLFLEARNYS